MTAINYKRAYTLVRKLDQVIERNDVLHDRFIVDGYDFWQAYRQRVFTFAKEWSRAPHIYRAHTDAPRKSMYVIHACFMLWSCMSLISAKLRGVTTLVYATDKINTHSKVKRDGRMGPVYDALDGEKVKYLEVVHAPYRKKALKTMLSRGRGVFYYEVASGFVTEAASLGEISFESFVEDEKQVAEDILRHCLALTVVSRRTIDRLSKVVKFLRIEKIISIDDPRYYHEVIVAGKKNNINTYAFQHGHLTKYHLGWLSFGKAKGNVAAPHRLYVRSPYWKNELKRLHTHIPIESIRFASSVTKEKLPEMQEDEQLHVVIPYETDAPKEEVRRFAEALELCDQFKVQFKARKDMDVDAQLNEYGLDIEAITDTDLTKPTIIIGTYSTYLYDMIAQYVPVGFLPSSIDFGEALITNDLAERIPQDHTVCQTVQDAFKRGMEKRETRRGVLIDTSVDTHKYVIKNIFNEKNA